MKYLLITIILTAGSTVSPSFGFDIQGTVKDADSNAVAEAIVRLTGKAAVDTTNSLGEFHLTESSASKYGLREARHFGVSMRREGERLILRREPGRSLDLDVFTLAGRHLIERKLHPGMANIVLPFAYAKSPLLVRLDDGTRSTLFLLHSIGNSFTRRKPVADAVFDISASAAADDFSDELVVEHPDFDPFHTQISDSAGIIALNIGSPWWKCQGDEGGTAFQVLWPNGGETLYVGDTVLLKFCAWHPEEDEITKVPPAVTNNGGISWTNLEVTNVGNRVYWAVPDSIYSAAEGKIVPLPSENCFIRISEYGNPFGNDDSDAPFTIRER